jgi:transposase-like protein
MLDDLDIDVRVIARRLGVSPATLYRYLPAARATVRSPIDAAEVVSLYAGGASTTDLARQFGVSLSRIRKTILKGWLAES